MGEADNPVTVRLETLTLTEGNAKRNHTLWVPMFPSFVVFVLLSGERETL